MNDFLKKFSAALGLVYFSAVICGSSYQVSQTVTTPNLDTVLAQGGTVAGGRVISLTDNLLPALSFREAANDYLVFRTTDGVEQVRITKNLNATTTAQINGILTVANGLNLGTTSTAVTGSVAATQVYVGFTGVAGGTLTLPAVAGVAAGTILVFKDEGGNAAVSNIILDGNAAELIDGAATKSIILNYGSFTLVMRNAAWWTI